MQKKQKNQNNINKFKKRKIKFASRFLGKFEENFSSNFGKYATNVNK